MRKSALASESNYMSAMENILSMEVSLKSAKAASEQAVRARDDAEVGAWTSRAIPTSRGEALTARHRMNKVTLRSC